jgi:hypothetical protein
MALRSHTMSDAERLADIARAVCASPAIRKAAARGDRKARKSAAHAHIHRDDSNAKPAMHAWLMLVAPFAFGFYIYGSATRRRFEAALPKALARLAVDCRCARELLSEQGDGADILERPRVRMSGGGDPDCMACIEFPPTMTDQDLAEMLPEIEAKARELFDEASRRTRHARANQETCHA